MRNKQTKIVATISDMRCDKEFLKTLYDCGMNVVRLNTAHQTFEDTLKVVNNVREVADDIPLLLDTKGPEVRTSKAEGKIEVKIGEKIQVKYGEFETLSTADVIYVSYEHFVRDVSVGNSILIDDGELELKVIAKSEDTLDCEVMNNGAFKSKKSVNVPEANLTLPSLTQKDIDYIHFAIEHDLEFIAHSFVRSKEDVKEIQDILDAKKSKIKIIAKIENREGVDNIDEILDCTYGIMVARGDLGIEIPAYEVPLIQKDLIQRAIMKNKVVITATQMLHTMIENPRPTRAEVSDVANAILDGTDAVMLSGETAYGNYPVEAVTTMAKIANEIEAQKWPLEELPVFETDIKIRSYLAKAAVSASLELNTKAIIVETSSGYSAQILASYRGVNPVYARCFDARVMKELALVYGVYGSHVDKLDKMSASIKANLEYLENKGQLTKEDTVIVLASSMKGGDSSTDTLEICKVSEYLN